MTEAARARPGGSAPHIRRTPPMPTIDLDPCADACVRAVAVGVAGVVLGQSVDVGETVVVTHLRGVGGTLAGNALSLAAMRATLSEVLTEEAFASMIDRATE